MTRARCALLAGVAFLATACAFGANPTVSPEPATSFSPKPAVQRWVGTIRSATFHDLYVGGRCTSAYSTTLTFLVRPAGAVSGHGRATLTSGPVCSFPLGQLQIKVLALKVQGRVAAGRLAFRLSTVRQVPAVGAIDYGGFLETVLSGGLRSPLEVRIGGKTSAEASLTRTVPGPDRDTFGSMNLVRLRCTNCPNG